ncbi:nucleotidyl transferase AbiEii/AbiGii toxin family protein [Alloscardovia macacae]|uniref:nucleotidyl transferase AbiEii/AbiGii toxin family protein n=1 Tax=Alloscardovia macacae TaxID=1160091 RepID=UPI001C5A91E6|nr:nucleotidyl transferase AbiEii/AbiGii toxin family protein [Alloscardovia macacae]
MKIDISSGDAITPDAVEYDYHLLLEDRTIRLRAYTVETIMAEKLETILVRGVLNTRMRDFYDVVMIHLQYGNTIDYAVLSDALTHTCRQRNTEYILENAENTLLTLRDDATVQSLWDVYRSKYEYARNMRYAFVMDSVSQIVHHLL